MKKLSYLLVLAMFLGACSANNSTENTEEATAESTEATEEVVEEEAAEEEADIKMIGDMMSFGAEISADGAISGEELLAQLSENDSLEVTVRSSVNSVCQKKGCWMKMDLGDGEDMMVRFKDYAFFVPLNSQDSEAVVRGKVKKSIISVDELKHYAEDDGKSQEEIDAISEPEETYTFLADGVLMKKA